MPHKKLEANLEKYAGQILRNNTIENELYKEHNIKRGLRNDNGTGVLVGITRVGEVVGYTKENGVKVPCEGEVYYRGYALSDLVKGFQADRRLGFEEIVYLLLFAKLPTKEELDYFNQVLDESRALPKGYKEDVIIKMSSQQHYEQTTTFSVDALFL